MKKQSLKFVVWSILGIILFFVPIFNGMVAIVYFTNIVNSLFVTHYILIDIMIVIAVIGAKIIKIIKCKKIEGNIVNLSIAFFSLGIMFCLANRMFFTNNIINEFFSLIYTVIITTFVSGIGVFVILRCGLIKFFAILVEPLMKKLFLLPGRGAIDCLASFVSSPSVGILFTSVCYEEGNYSEKEACSIVTNFSVVSIGFMSVLCSMAGIEKYFPEVIITSFMLVIILAIIIVRIPPLSHKRNTKINNYMFKSKEEIIKEEKKLSRISKAVEAGALASNEFSFKNSIVHITKTLDFIGRMVILMVIPLTIMLYVTNYTTIMLWIGKPFEIILSIMQIPNAELIAPTILLGVIEVALPAMYISDSHIANGGAFFVVVLSIVQVIFFSETGLVILSSKIPLKVSDLLLIFFERTLIAIPILAIILQILF